MGNVFGEFIQTAENAKAMIQKKFGKNLSGFQINRMALVKFFFFSKEEIKKSSISLLAKSSKICYN